MNFTLSQIPADLQYIIINLTMILKNFLKSEKKR
jgi:hypothetical protein